jgi:hypothetical protein
MCSKAGVFEPSDRVTVRNGNDIEKTPDESRAVAELSAGGPQDWRAAQVREWLLLLLRFAITRDPKDQAAAYAMARDIDSFALQGQSTPSFFRRTSDEVCAAISASDDDPHRKVVLKQHLARIEDIRLRQTFQAAVDLEGRSARVSAKARRGDLWVGLPR